MKRVELVQEVVDRLRQAARTGMRQVRGTLGVHPQVGMCAAGVVLHYNDYTPDFQRSLTETTMGVPHCDDVPEERYCRLFTERSNIYTYVIHLNDGHKLSFNEIANILEHQFLSIPASEVIDLTPSVKEEVLVDSTSA